MELIGGGRLKDASSSERIVMDKGLKRRPMDKGSGQGTKGDQNTHLMSEGISALSVLNN